MTTTTTPTRTRAQRMAALTIANRIRSYRSRMKTAIRASERHDAAAMVSILVQWPGDELASMRIRDLLLCMPRIGQMKVDRFMRGAQISQAKTIAGLSDRQRDQVVVWTHELRGER